MPEFNSPIASNQIVNEERQMTQQFRTWVNNVTRESTIVGTGSPEGVIEASQYREYIDSSGSTGTIKYIKMLADIGGDTKQGWTLI
jgi:hypothetical protein